jgi:hypothetical protein
MKIINNINNTKPTRTINTCTNSEAFRLGNDWYSVIIASDFGVRQREKDFVEEHTLYGYDATSFIALVPCLHISSMSLVYIDGRRTAEEWATLTATLTTP